MAVYVLMKKIKDNEKKVVYKFGPNDNLMGIIEFDKNQKTFNIIKKVSDDISMNKAYEKWAAEKIVKIMYRENGIFPNETAVEK